MANGCGTIGKPVLVVAADLGSPATDDAKVIWQMLDPLRERHVPMNGVSLFAFMASSYMHTYGATERQLAMVTVKNRAKGAHNPFEQLREPVTLEQVLASAPGCLADPQFADWPRGGGAAAVVVAPTGFPQRQNSVAVRGLGACAGVDSIGDRGARGGADLFRASALTRAAGRAYRMAGIEAPDQAIDVAEVYSSYPAIELVSLEALGLAFFGGAAAAMQSGRLDHDGPLPVNFSGGATCGNPLSATALLRVVELVHLLRVGAGGAIGRAFRTGLAAGFGGASQLHEVAILGAR